MRDAGVRRTDGRREGPGRLLCSSRVPSAPFTPDPRDVTSLSQRVLAEPELPATWRVWPLGRLINCRHWLFYRARQHPRVLCKHYVGLCCPWHGFVPSPGRLCCESLTGACQATQRLCLRQVSRYQLLGHTAAEAAAALGPTQS